MTDIASSTTYLMAVPEQFDANFAALQGKVYRVQVWKDSSLLAEVQPVDVNNRIALIFPGGQMAGEDISLMPGDDLNVKGWIRDAPYAETLQEFLVRARQKELLEKYPELGSNSGISRRRSLTCLVPEIHAQKPSSGGSGLENNYVRVDGVITRVWRYGNHAYIRLAVYDQHTPEIPGQVGNGGRPRREPHYLSVQFTQSQVDGRLIRIAGRGEAFVPGTLRPEDRIRVTGRFILRRYQETLRDFLGAAKRLDLAAQLTDGDRLLDEVRALYYQTAVEARKIVQFG